MTSNVRGTVSGPSIVCLIVLLFASFAGMRTPARATGLADDQQRLQHIFAQRDRLKARLAAETRIENRLAKRVRSPNFKPTRAVRLQLASAIKTTWRQVAAMDGQLAATAAESRYVHREAAQLVPRIVRLKRDIHRQLANVRASLIQLYDLSRVSPLEQVLEAKSLTDFLVQQGLVTQIGADDVAVLSRARLQRTRLLKTEASYRTMTRELRAFIGDDRIQRDLFRLQAEHLNHLLADVQRINAKLAAEAEKRRKAASNKGLAVPSRSSAGAWSTYLVTAYCLTGVTASGAWTHPGTMAATLPFGTRLYVPGYGSGTVQDRGGAIGPGHVDLYMASCGAALQWGARVMPIKILG